MKLFLIPIAVLWIAAPLDAVADRFQERLIRKNIGDSQSGNSVAVDVYLRKAKRHRLKGNLFIADYLAGRAASFVSSNLRPNIHGAFEAVVVSGFFDDAFRRAVARLNSAAACDAWEWGVEEIKLISLFEELLLNVISEKEPLSREMSDFFVRRVSKAVPKSGCSELPNVGSNGTQIDWNLPASSRRQLRDVVGNWVEGFAYKKDRYETMIARNGAKHVFPKRMYGKAEALTPCSVMSKQFTLYYDIDVPIFEGPMNNWLLDVAIESFSGAGFVVEAHADSGGGGRRNLELAKERGVVVAEELERRGVKAEDIKLIVLGAHCPQVAMGADRYVRANRRVTLRPLK